MKKLKPQLFVASQFSLIFALLSAGAINDKQILNVLLAVSVFVGLWAILEMKFRVNILPTVRTGQELFISGPYKYIRHPMYTAVLGSTLSWVIDDFSVLMVIGWVALVYVLILKSNYEESLLQKRFKEYKKYKHNSKKFIPLIF